MSCTEHQRTINRFVDHEVKATGCAELFDHLGTCPVCRAFFDNLTDVSILLEKVQLSTPDEALHSERNPLQKPLQRQANRRPISIRSSTIALVLLTIFLFGIVFSARVEMKLPDEPEPQSSVR